MSLYQRLRGHAEFQPDKTAIDSEAGQISYQQLKLLTDWCIAYFHALGLGAGDRVAILSLNHPDWFIATFAAARSGIVLVPLNWRLSDDELKYVVEDSEPAVLLHSEEFTRQATQIQNAFKKLRLVDFASGNFPPEPSESTNQPGTTNQSGTTKQPDTKKHSVTKKQSDANEASHEANDQNAALLIVYTSGTTGRPKGAVLSQKSILCSAEMSQHMTDMTANDCVLNVLPLFHVGGLNIQPLPALLYGATLVLHARFHPEEAVKALISKKITLVNSVPTLLQAMLSASNWAPDQFPALRAISIGSTDVPVSLIEKVQASGIPLIQVYGATETGPVAIYQRIEHADNAGSIGKAGILCEVRLCNSEGEEVPDGESGEIHIKGNNILSRYWRNDIATDSCINDGWFATGDVAHKDREGFYWFDDRLKHVVISGGENIYPAEIERVLREVPGIDEVAVVGRADARWGQVPVAVVVGTAGRSSIMDACDSLARFKKPADVVFVDALPRNALGKVLIQQVSKIVS